MHYNNHSDNSTGGVHMHLEAVEGLRLKRLNMKSNGNAVQMPNTKEIVREPDTTGENVRLNVYFNLIIMSNILL
jgi:hypothetical protein